MPKDWLFKLDQHICNFRSVGVLVDGEKILLQRDRDGNEYALPGGHVQIGETSEAALIREFKEETGADIHCRRLLWTEECFWQWGEKSTHTIAFYYLIELAAGSAIPDLGEFVSQKDNCNVVLGWMPIAELKNLTVYPSFLPEKIVNLNVTPEHFVTYA